VDTIDQTLADSISQFFQTSFTVLGSIAMVVTFLPWLGVLMLPLLFLYYRIMYYYRASSRELKRIEALARSPVYATFSETLLGLDSVRAYHQQPRLQVSSRLRRISPPIEHFVGSVKRSEQSTLR
jgi:ATP-binding cassette subfamily C (CFTR/MRP) protein 1